MVRYDFSVSLNGRAVKMFVYSSDPKKVVKQALEIRFNQRIAMMNYTFQKRRVLPGTIISSDGKPLGPPLLANYSNMLMTEQSNG